MLFNFLPNSLLPYLPALIAFTILLVVGHPVIRQLRKMKIGDVPEFDQEKINELMAGKKGTPTMGGVMIVGAIVIALLLVAPITHPKTWIGLFVLISLCLVGSFDDRMKLKLARLKNEGKPIPSTRQGMSSRTKFILQLLIGALAIGAFIWFSPATEHFFNIPSILSFQISQAFVIIIGMIWITGFSNSVNLTDGMDGLAAGCSAIVSTSIAIGLTLAGAQPSSIMLASAIAGACFGFLIFNHHPANVFMGDTGSLALGGLLGYIAVVEGFELLLVVMGIVFVIEALSVMMQVGYFKYTKKKYGEGRRIFRMSPLHHHFQLGGWSESRIVFAAWFITLMMSGLGAFLLARN